MVAQETGNISSSIPTTSNEMVRGTTPTFSLYIADNEVDLTQALNVYATFKQQGTIITKTGTDLQIVTARQVNIYMSQEDTLKFVPGKMEIQLNWTYPAGLRACSNIAYVMVAPNLIGSVLE